MTEQDGSLGLPGLVDSVASSTESKTREPWRPIVARVCAAVFGGYSLAYTAGLAAAKFLPMRPSEAVFLISALQLTLYLGVVIWTFAVTGWRACLILFTLSALCLGAAQFK